MRKVVTQQGTLEGMLTADGAVRVFKGIPYAEPPVGPLRWKAPLPPRRWDGARRADSYGPAPIQPVRPANSLTWIGDEGTSEDCLYLNVWTAAKEADDKRPVMVWLPFGALIMGSGAAAIWDGESLARQGAVVVTFNFRLGRFGFLAHPELGAESGHGASGNYGLMDQIAALHWVRDNIAAFGGDPDCVTLFGQSSGASCINLLMASPLARGLFHRAIAQSGGQFEPPRPNIGWPALSGLRDAEADGVRLAQSIGASTLAEMRQRSPDQILKASTPSQPINWRQGLVNPAFLCGYAIVDGYIVPERGVRAVYESGDQHDIPLITGFTAREGGGKTGVRNLQQLHDEAARYGDLGPAYLAAFPANNDAEALAQSSIAIGDQLFAWQSWTFARLHARTSRNPVFYYHFERVPAYPPGVKWMETDGDPATELGAIHGCDIPYVFDNLHRREGWPWKTQDRELSRIMSAFWIQFARTGDPNAPGLPEWPRFAGPVAPTLFFGDTVRVGSAPAQQRLAFWDRVFSVPGLRK